MINGVRAKTPGKIRAAVAQRAFSAVERFRRHACGGNRLLARADREEHTTDGMRASAFIGGTRALVGSRVFPVRPSDKSFVRAKADPLLFHITIVRTTIVCTTHAARTHSKDAPPHGRLAGFFHSFNFVCYFIYIFYQRRSHTVVVRRFGQVGSFNQSTFKLITHAGLLRV